MTAHDPSFKYCARSQTAPTAVQSSRCCGRWFEHESARNVKTGNVRLRQSESCGAGGSKVAGNKTVQTTVDPYDFISEVEDEQKRRDSEELIALMKKVTGKPP